MTDDPSPYTEVQHHNTPYHFWFTPYIVCVLQVTSVTYVLPNEAINAEVKTHWPDIVLFICHYIQQLSIITSSQLHIEFSTQIQVTAVTVTEVIDV